MSQKLLNVKSGTENDSIGLNGSIKMSDKLNNQHGIAVDMVSENASIMNRPMRAADKEDLHMTM